MPQPYSRTALENVFCFSGQIAITAKTAEGSSTLITNLKKIMSDLPYRWVSGGALMRARALAHGNMPIEDFAAHCKNHPEEEHDSRLDKTIGILAEHNWVVCEGRLPHVFMPLAFKVRFKCNLEERVVRRVAQNDGKLSYSAVESAIIARDSADDARYEVLYPGCLWPDSHYDCVIDNAQFTPEGAAKAVVERHKAWLERMTVNLNKTVAHEAVAPLGN